MRLLRHSAVLTACVALATPSLAQDLRIHYINVGWGGAALVVGPDGTTVLLDGGNTGRGTQRIVPYLNSIGITAAQGLDYTIVSHQHCDHNGGIDEVVQAGWNVHVENWDNGSTYSTSCVTQWDSVAATTTAGVPIAMPVGTVVQLGNGATMTCVARNGAIIGGGSVAVSDENDRSIALLVKYGGFEWLWAGDLGGGQGDSACTGRTTAQTNVETFVLQAISPGGAFPLISSGGIDALHVNHHGSESSTNNDWFDLSRPAVALIATGGGQASTYHLPRKDVVEKVLLSQATSCVSAPPALVLQTEEGNPTGTNTSFAGYCVGNIVLATDGVASFTVFGDGAVTVGPNELAAAGLPRVFALDDVSTPPDTTPPAAPSALVTTAGNGRVDLAWAANTEADLRGYEVYRSNTAGVLGNKLNGATLNANLYTDTTATNGTTWWYTIKAVDTSGNLSNGSVQSSASPTAPPRPAVQVWINELHYDNNGNDRNEFVELAGRAGTNFAGWRLVGYNGSNGLQYSTVLLSGALTNQSNGFGVRSFLFRGLENGAPDGVAVVDASGQVVQFLSYEGSFTALDGPALGLTSTPIPVAETGTGPTNGSIRLIGNGCNYNSFTWAAPSTANQNAINAGQTFAVGCP
jgi:beta-lactamase superfamily II metal-dependent hydrolase